MHSRLMCVCVLINRLINWFIVCLTANVRAESSPDLADNTYLFRQLVDDSLDGDTDVKRAMGMLRMGRSSAADDVAVKKAMGMLRMGRSSTADAADKRAMGMLRMGRSFEDGENTSKRKMSMLRMGRAMGMLRMGRPSAAETADNDDNKRAMSMLRMGWRVVIFAQFLSTSYE